MKFNKFVLGGILIIAAVGLLVFTSLQANAQYFLTVEELNAKGKEVVGRDVRISGAVLGDTIQYDAKNLQLTFTIAHIPGDNKELETEGGLAQALHDAVMDPTRERLVVHYEGVRPDLLKNEAQAILTGKLGEDGIFYATDLLLKCPSRYEEAVPEQSN